MPEHVVFAWPGRYLTRLGTIGDDWLIDSAFDGTFRVNRAITEIHLYSATNPPSEACADVLVRRILPRLMIERGAVTIHAAAGAIGGAGVLLLGSSGAGKSTFTAGLATMQDWGVFSDDLSVLWEASPPLVAPAATGACVWEASRIGLGLDPTLCHIMPGYDGKVRYEPPGALATAPVPLRAFVFLAREDGLREPKVSEMNRSEALIRAAQQLIYFNPAARKFGEEAVSIGRLSRIAEHARMLRLHYPSGFDVLPMAANALAREVT